MTLIFFICMSFLSYHFTIDNGFVALAFSWGL